MFKMNLVLGWDVIRTMTLSPRANCYQLGQFSTVQILVNETLEFLFQRHEDVLAYLHQGWSYNSKRG